ncbi:hypothetical protein CPB86DRAFT_226365 [Serendipita vermifera]|nr:hypothetical protein CPB86DRAFT_226365 [Serendipita vermifera]
MALWYPLVYSAAFSEHFARIRMEELFMTNHRGIPPIKGIPIVRTPAAPIKRLWKVLKTCRNKDPRLRPSASQLQEYISSHRSAIQESMGEDFVLAPPSLV